jgi:crotonobetainyl-CoA:carnitine CoA-transferase CaiB-like acyl-CoA transferase
MTMVLPLDGLRVVECGRTSMAAYCSRLLADAGAEVVKVEPPEGDPARKRGPFPRDEADPERSGLFMLLNVNKRGVCLDLEQRNGRRDLAKLLDWAQVLVMDFQPQEAERLGLIWRRLHRRHPHLLVTSITPFGESGPYRDYHTNEHVVYNMGGLGYATPGMPDHVDDIGKEPPLRPSTPIAEFIAGATGTTATLFALLVTMRDGWGRHVEVSAHEAVASMVFRDVVHYSYIRLITGRRPVQTAWMPNAVMPCKDGYVVIATPWDSLWKRLVEVMDNPEWAKMDVFQDARQRGANWDALQIFLMEWTMRFTGDEIMQMAHGAGVPCFPAFTVNRIVGSIHERERGYFWETPIEGDGIAKIPGSPFIFSQASLYLRRPAPRLGEHNDELLVKSEDMSTGMSKVSEGI